MLLPVAQFTAKLLFDLGIRTLALADHLRICIHALAMGIVGSRRQQGAVGARPEAPAIIAFILAQERVDASAIRQVLRCIQWSRSLGHVQHVLVYDPVGGLKEALADRATHSNEHFGDPQVYLISAADAMQPLLDVARGPALPTLADQPAQQGPLQARVASGAAASAPDDVFQSAIDPAVINTELERRGPPWATLRPEVAFVFGPMLTLAGFPPWCSTRMEILHLGDLDGATEGRLARAMDRYRRTQQRFGR